MNSTLDVTSSNTKSNAATSAPAFPHRSMQLAQLIDRHRIRLVLRFHENAALLAMLGWRRMDGFAIIKPFAVGP